MLETVAAVLPDQFRWTADTNCFSGLNRAVLPPTPFCWPLSSSCFRPGNWFFLTDQSVRFNRPEMFSEPAIFCCRGSLVLQRSEASLIL